VFHRLSEKDLDCGIKIERRKTGRGIETCNEQGGHLERNIQKPIATSYIKLGVGKRYKDPGQLNTVKRNRVRRTPPTLEPVKENQTKRRV